ncbi:MAG TPA: LpxL/LpxP family Kdo(2)-lipid IV(A) lauroyl/palmitoleoyl acyltransferase [Rhodanobacteraceae bacterium]|nr:LpxL/LpxP family Kdo(2)-lipid IV(A) lauroyl/palmitoleoyl acyltransferase [Rhodanobacteraceae bacterium]
MADVRPTSPRLWAPRHWPAWLGVAAIWLAARLPHAALLRLGAGLGRLIAALPSGRKQIAARNLELCFPDMGAAGRAALLQRNLRDMGIMLGEFSLGWLGSDRHLARIRVELEGLEHLEALRVQGRGVLLVGAHFSHLELCARLVSRRFRIAGMYRRMDSPVFEHVVLRARLGYADAMYTKNDVLGCVRYLRGGGVLWYAPDQDMRGKGHVFAPFFGIPAATITATHHLARLSGAAVLPFFHHRRDDGSYCIRLEPPLEDFPGSDVVADTARINGAIEAMVREAPEQYLWAHKRFKTRPPGAPNLYAGR